MDHFLCVLTTADFFKIIFFENNLLVIQPEPQTVWIQIRPEIFSDLISVQTFCIGYQQMGVKGARTFWPRTFRPRTFWPGHFGHGHSGHGKVSTITINFGFGMCACISLSFEIGYSLEYFHNN